MISRRMTLEYVCNAHANRKSLDPMQREHVLAQLKAEGHKRIESFLFEQIFSRFIVECCTETNVSLGWSFQRDAKNIPVYWFKLNRPGSQWNACDDYVTNFLLSLRCVVVVVEYNYGERRFYASQHLNGVWEPQQAIDTVLQRVSGYEARDRIREANPNLERQRQAIDAIAQHFSDTELYHLSLSRLLIGCYLAPWFKKQPMDIDAFCLVNNQLRIVEFKRKYPAASGVFGLDTDPHGLLVDWLGQAGAVLHHVILVDPLWNDSVPPMHLLNEASVTAVDAMWIGTELTATAFTGNFFKTSGADSGMFGGDRTQRQIKSDIFHLIARGMALPSENLRSFLSDLDALPIVPIETLRNARDIARRKYYSAP